MSTHITGKLISVGEYPDEEQIGSTPLARAVVVCTRDQMREVQSLPMYEEVTIIKTSDLAAATARADEQFRLYCEETKRHNSTCAIINESLRLLCASIEQVAHSELPDKIRLLLQVLASEKKAKVERGEMLVETTARAERAEAESLEQARLLGMSAQRESDLRGEVARLRAAMEEGK